MSSAPISPVRLDAPGLLEAKGSRAALGGFFLSGLLLTFLGAILPAWGYHLNEQYIAIGNYFLALNWGLLLANRFSTWLLLRRGIRVTLLIASGSACTALLYLAWFSPPYASGWRLAGLFILGAAVGLLHPTIFQAVSPIYRHNPAGTLNLAGIFFGLGCLAMALLVWAAYYVYTVPSILIFVAVIPAFFLIGYSRSEYQVPVLEPRSFDQTLKDLRSPLAIPFGLLLLFQFANEWSVAGWLAIFLTQRLGWSPETALLYLALYLASLLIGRVVSQAVLPFVSHPKFLFVAVMAAWFGCIVLSFTDNRFGVISGILFLGGGFAPIFPLVVEKIGDRFPHSHPVTFQGIFSLAFTGALLFPAALGYLARWLGVKSIMAAPLIGTGIVFLLLVIIWIESTFLAKPRS